MTGPVHSISQAFAILRLLAHTSPLTLTDIGRAIGSSPSSCLNLLKTLAGEGAIERDEQNKRYRLTPAWQGVEALQDGRSANLVDRAQPLMAQFAQAHEVAVGLWKIVSRDRMQLVAHAESDAGMRLTLADDQRQPLGAGAAGRAIAAAQAIDGSESARRFEAVRWQSDLPFTSYVAQINEAALKGFALDRGYAHRGVYTVAVAIADIPPGYCLTASLVAESRGSSDIDRLGDALTSIGVELALRQN